MLNIQTFYNIKLGFELLNLLIIYIIKLLFIISI